MPSRLGLGAWNRGWVVPSRSVDPTGPGVATLAAKTEHRGRNPCVEAIPREADPPPLASRGLVLVLDPRGTPPRGGRRSGCRPEDRSDDPRVEGASARETGLSRTVGGQRAWSVEPVLRRRCCSPPLIWGGCVGDHPRSTSASWRGLSLRCPPSPTGRSTRDSDWLRPAVGPCGRPDGRPDRRNARPTSRASSSFWGNSWCCVRRAAWARVDGELGAPRSRRSSPDDLLRAARPLDRVLSPTAAPR